MLLDVNELPDAKEIRVYPNPTTGIVVIDSPIPVNATVYNTLGQKLKTVIDATRLDLSEFPAGSYLLMLTDSYSVPVKNIILSKSE